MGEAHGAANKYDMSEAAQETLRFVVFSRVYLSAELKSAQSNSRLLKNRFLL